MAEASQYFIVRRQAEQLSADERIRLAESLLADAQDENSAREDQEWADLADRRWADVQAGRSRDLDAAEGLTRLESELREGRAARPPGPE